MKLVLLILLAVPLVAQTPYRWSVAALAVGSVADTHSSWRGYELNPILGRGQFGWRGVAIKAGITGASLLCQRRVLRRHPRMRPTFTAMNFGMGAAMGAVAVRNYEVRK